MVVKAALPFSKEEDDNDDNDDNDDDDGNTEDVDAVISHPAAKEVSVKHDKTATATIH